MCQCTVQRMLQTEVAESKKESEKSANYIGLVPICTYLNIHARKKNKNKYLLNSDVHFVAYCLKIQIQRSVVFSRLNKLRKIVNCDVPADANINMVLSTMCKNCGKKPKL